MTESDRSNREIARSVNSGVDNHLQLVYLDDVQEGWQENHPIQALIMNGRDWVNAELREWKASSPTEYRKILRTFERVGKFDRVRDEKYVRRDAKDTGIYEMKCKGHPRVLFFYDTDPQETVICVLAYWKGRGDQGNAFEKAATLKDIWNHSSKPKPRSSH